MKDLDFEQHNAIDRLKRRDIESDDLQREIAGVQAGRQQKFLPAENHPTTRAEKQRREYAELSALELLLQDPEYLALYNETTTLITDAMSITEEELDREHKQLKILTEQRDDMRCDANRLADGRLVFKNKLGDVITENDEVVTDQVLLDGIVWKENAPTYEEFIINRDAIRSTHENINALTYYTYYQVEVLGAAQARMSDENNPPSKKELEEIKREIVDEAPESVRKQLTEASNPTYTQNMSHQIAEFKM